MNANFISPPSGKLEFLLSVGFSAVKLARNIIGVIKLGKHGKDYTILQEKVKPK